MPVSSPFKWKHAPQAADPDHIAILYGWDLLNIGSFACEPLARWTKGRSRMVSMNHSVRESFLELWAAWEKAGVLVPLAPAAWGGAYNPRYKRGVPHDQNPAHLSNHSTGHAFDICPGKYVLGYVPSPTDPIHQLVPIAESHGWKWGGKFSRCDAMHFQHVSSPFP